MIIRSIDINQQRLNCTRESVSLYVTRLPLFVASHRENLLLNENLSSANSIKQISPFAHQRETFVVHYTPRIYGSASCGKKSSCRSYKACVSLCLFVCLVLLLFVLLLSEYMMILAL